MFSRVDPEQASFEFMLQHLHLLTYPSHHIAVLLGPSNQVRHNLLPGAEWHVLVSAVTMASECVRQMVRHTQKLSEKRPAGARVEAELVHGSNPCLDAVLVVRCDHHFGTVAGDLLYEHSYAAVVVLMRVLDGVVNGARISLLQGLCSLQDHVRSTDQLGAKLIALRSRRCNLSSR